MSLKDKNIFYLFEYFAFFSQSKGNEASPFHFRPDEPLVHKIFMMKCILSTHHQLVTYFLINRINYSIIRGNKFFFFSILDQFINISIKSQLISYERSHTQA
jgi:hypothetical protein